MQEVALYGTWEDHLQELTEYVQRSTVVDQPSLHPHAQGEGAIVEPHDGAVPALAPYRTSQAGGVPARLRLELGGAPSSLRSMPVCNS
jgi:hypothetical protein